jgi:hypothetical protein
MTKHGTGHHAGSAAVQEHGRLRPLMERVRSEYAEMPGLCLTRAQAQRLWGLDSSTCDAVLTALVDAGYLRATARGFLRQ